MNTFQNGTFGVIHSSTNYDFTNNIYSAIYVLATGSETINGTSFTTTVAGETIPIIVKDAGTTVSARILLLGNPKPTGLDKTGKISGTTYQFIDIKTGLPTQQS
jgi:hypothetical protein|tara:strand:+ start:239 stop:550 length:312 start_codon:yes stop_codon:yes gene_type:complete